MLSYADGGNCKRCALRWAVSKVSISNDSISLSRISSEYGNIRQFFCMYQENGLLANFVSDDNSITGLLATSDDTGTIVFFTSGDCGTDDK